MNNNKSTSISIAECSRLNTRIEDRSTEAVQRNRLLQNYTTLSGQAEFMYVFISAFSTYIFSVDG